MKEHKLEVWLGNRLAGTMAETGNHRFAFAYSDEQKKPAEAG